MNESIVIYFHFFNRTPTSITTKSTNSLRQIIKENQIKISSLANTLFFAGDQELYLDFSLISQNVKNGTSITVIEKKIKKKQNVCFTPNKFESYLYKREADLLEQTMRISDLNFLNLEGQKSANTTYQLLVKMQEEDEEKEEQLKPPESSLILSSSSYIPEEALPFQFQVNSQQLSSNGSRNNYGSM